MAAGDVAKIAATSSGLGGGGDKQPNPAARLGVAILLFWLAGVCLFIAFGSGAKDLAAWGGKGSGFKELRKALSTMFSRGGTDIAKAKGGGTSS